MGFFRVSDIRRSPMKLISPILLVILAVLSLAGQSSPNQAGQQLPTFRAETELVTVPVVVTKGGKHVTGLTKDDFTVLEDGSPRPAAFFEEIKATPGAIKPEPSPANAYNNEIAKDQQPT